MDKKSDNVAIACIGAANVDRKAKILSEVRLHSSNPVSSVITCGGVARNIAETLGRLGCHTNLITRIGSDTEGEWIRSSSFPFVHFPELFVHPTEKTGSYTAILNSVGGMVIAIAEMGIYDTIDCDFIKDRWKYIASAQCVVLDTNFPSHVLAFIIRRCHMESIPLCVVPGSGAKVNKLPRSFQGISHLIVNKEEAQIILGMPINLTKDYIQAGYQLIESGAKNVIITSGKEGIFYISAAEQGWIISPQISVVDVTGAGDAFVAGYLFAQSKGMDLKSACLYGMSCSVLCLQTSETVPSGLNEFALTEIYKQYFEKEQS